MIDAGIDNFKELAKAIGMKYDTFLVRMKDPTSFRLFEINARDAVGNGMDLLSAFNYDNFYDVDENTYRIRGLGGQYKLSKDEKG